MPTLPNRPSPVPIAIIVAALAVALTAMGMAPGDVRAIMTEMLCLATGYAVGRSGQPPTPVQ